MMLDAWPEDSMLEEADLLRKEQKESPACNKCGGALAPAPSDALVPVVRCADCGREIPRGAFRD